METPTRMPAPVRQPSPEQAGKNPPGISPALVHVALLALAISLSVNIVVLYITSERYFYFWDLGGYQGVAIIIARSFQDSIRATLLSIQQSLDLEYNYFYTLPLVPWINLFGQTRLGYVLSVSLVYQLPYALAAGAIARKLIRANPLAVFWVTVFLALLMPITWAPTLRSYPDVGAAMLVSFAMLLYLVDPGLKKWWQILGIGLLIALAMLLRRHFTYSILAFLVTISLLAMIEAIQVGLNQLKQSPAARRTAFIQGVKALFWSGLRIGIVVGIAILTLLIIGKPFLLRAITVNYASLYTSYVQDVGTMAIWFRWMYGRGVWLLVALGYGLGLYRRVLRPLPATFLLVFGAISIIQWMVIVRYTSIPYATHTTIFILLGLSALLWTIWTNLKGLPRMLCLFGFGVFTAANLIVGLAPVKPPETILKILSAQHPPLVRHDYNQVVRLVDFLREEATQKPIYVVDSSGLMNFDLLIKAEQALYSDQKLSVIETPQIDSRDYYPIEQLLQAEYLIVTTPFQFHLSDPEQQRVVKVVYEAFINDWEIAQDFEKLPLELTLDGGATLNIYKRARPTQPETALRFYNQAREYIEQRPGSQPDWIILNKPLKFLSKMKPGEPASIEFELPETLSTPPEVVLLFANDLAGKISLVGDWEFLDNHCQGVVIRAQILDAEGSLLQSQEQSLSVQPNQSKISFEFDPQPAASNLLLSIDRIGPGGMDNLCRARLDWQIAGELP